MHLKLSDLRVNFTAVDLYCAGFLWRFSECVSRFMKPEGLSSFMVFIHRPPWYLCRVQIFNKHNMTFHSIFPFGSQEHIPFTFLILIRKFTNPRLVIYSSLRICYGLLQLMKAVVLNQCPFFKHVHYINLRWFTDILIFGVQRQSKICI